MEDSQSWSHPRSLSGVASQVIIPPRNRCSARIAEIESGLHRAAAVLPANKPEPEGRYAVRLRREKVPPALYVKIGRSIGQASTILPAVRKVGIRAVNERAPAVCTQQAANSAGV
ncbi:MAG: hypothetical protein DWQ34_06445 [Planctomycetota bacterium]|nr:MAG: hypothetical protein DWQ29_19965 [Planctomycetota bacterium]REJ95339.1 MAG: hypothetical protein DWQ34_06445 [Planctomycetota bacterium]REK24219.1 MAG: hypothetical protein DWQ41_14375 [Planctomycetota bacterium]REK28795.1 MAG: hypothetical protein DWQ45_24140 [Planctomycetota bacterium]